MAAVMSYSVNKEHILRQFLLHILIAKLFNKDYPHRKPNVLTLKTTCIRQLACTAAFARNTG